MKKTIWLTIEDDGDGCGVIATTPLDLRRVGSRKGEAYLPYGGEWGYIGSKGVRLLISDPVPGYCYPITVEVDEG